MVAKQSWLTCPVNSISRFTFDEGLTSSRHLERLIGCWLKGLTLGVQVCGMSEEGDAKPKRSNLVCSSFTFRMGIRCGWIGLFKSNLGCGNCVDFFDRDSKDIFFTIL
jgi:hypothetical protein